MDPLLILVDLQAALISLPLSRNFLGIREGERESERKVIPGVSFLTLVSRLASDLQGHCSSDLTGGTRVTVALRPGRLLEHVGSRASRMWLVALLV